MTKKSDIYCECCKQPYDAFFTWNTEPFSKRAPKIICHCCVCALVSHIAGEGEDAIEIVGQAIAPFDIKPLSALIEDGFDKKQATVSLKAVGKIIGIKPRQLTKQLKA